MGTGVPGGFPGSEDTIVALATATGRGAIALIRISGARAMSIARALGASTLEPRRATRVRLVDPDSQSLLEDALVTWFVAPHSYTGEDVVEIATHGGAVAPTRVITACVAQGARPAYPGEFTHRAVLAGRMDLLQAEAVADLIDARTTAMHEQALHQLDGGLSRRLLALRADVIHLEALLAYDVDFPEEDDGPIDRSQIAAAATVLIDALRALLRTAPQGAMRRDGVLVVIAGPPNAGKSSLFNALLGASRAIVTPTAGTTRDAIEALLDRQPFPLRLVDTAGLRDTDDALERLGIEVSGRYLGEAQIVLACGATSDEVAQSVAAVAGRTAGVVLPVRTKADLSGLAPSDHASVSAETGVGLSSLLSVIDDAVREAMSEGDYSTAVDAVVITRARHRVGLETALQEVEAFQSAWLDGALPVPVVATHLLAAREAISDLIGVVDTEEILGRVFADFCIGK